MLITENVINSPSFLFYITPKAGRCETDDLNHSVLFFYFILLSFLQTDRKAHKTAEL